MPQQLVTIQCNIKAYRQLNSWSQEDLAQKVQVRRQAIYDMESGRYLPNTVVALRLARVFGCTVEELFTESSEGQVEPVQVVGKTADDNARLVLGRVRGNLVGIPLNDMHIMPFNLHAADGFLCEKKKKAQIVSPQHILDQTIIIMGCDPALEILDDHIKHVLTSARIRCMFASSKRALDSLAQGVTHVAATHFHNTAKAEANITAVNKTLPGISCLILGFSFLEEGLMVAKGNPQNIRSVTDLAQPEVQFVNRERGAALRNLLDTQLASAGIPSSSVKGYETEVCSHYEGAYHVACRAANAALGLRAVAEAFGLHFVPVATTRCDLVIPTDLKTNPAISALLDVMQSSRLRAEITALPGYDSTFTGKEITK